MKRFTSGLVCLTIATLVSLSGCGGDTSSGQPVPEPVLVVKETGGTFDNIRPEQVLAIEITVVPNPLKPATKLTRAFTGARAVEVVKALGFNKPMEVGLPAAMATGSIVIAYQDPTGEPEQRVFDLLNGKIIEDRSHPEVLYRAPVEINESWLRSQAP